jgi:hypothetical protein
MFRGVRTALNCHAFTYSLTQTVRYEVLQHEISILYSDNNTLLLFENTAPVFFLAYLTWFSVSNFNEMKIKKLDEISEYKNTRTMARMSLLIFIHIFFRNIENAI